MGNFQTSGGIILIILGILGIIFSSFLFAIGASPEYHEDSSISPAGWYICGTISIIFSIIMLALGWRLLSKKYSSMKFIENTQQYSIQKPVIVHNMGDYIAGDKMDINEYIQGDRKDIKHISTGETIKISDSVIHRSNIGGDSGDWDNLAPNKKELLRRYKSILRNVMADGVITSDEAQILEIMRKSDDITIEDHYKMLDEINREK